MEQQTVVAGVVLGLLLLAHSHLSLAAPAPAPAAAQPPAFESTYNALMSLNETQGSKAAIVSFLTSPQGLTRDLIDRYQYILPIAQSRDSTTTAFIPTNRAWAEFGRELCMTPAEVQQYSSVNPGQVMTQVEQAIANTTKPVYIQDFKDGMTLPTFNKGFSLTLHKRLNKGGSYTWVLPGMSPNGSDIEVVQSLSNIRTGKAVLHMIDGIVTDTNTRKTYWIVRNESCDGSYNKSAALAALASASDNAAASSPGGSAMSGAWGLGQQQVWCKGSWVGLLAAVGAALLGAMLQT